MSRRAQTVELPPQYELRIDPLRPAAEQIAGSLKRAILEMSLTPGQIISEAEVGHLFGASRTPVREAFSKLREDGLVTTYPSRGSFVSKLSVAAIRGAQYVREALEVSVAESLAEAGLPDEVSQSIERCLALQQSHGRAGDGPAFHDEDDRFHMMLADAVGQTRLVSILRREKTILDRLRVFGLQSTEHVATLTDDHKRIYQAIRSRNGPAARDEVKFHLRRVLDTLSDLVDAHSEYFDD